jgi:hypothetical protein
MPTAHPNHAERRAELQDQLYDLVVTRLAAPATPDAMPGLSRDAEHAAALADAVAHTAQALVPGPRALPNR